MNFKGSKRLLFFFLTFFICILIFTTISAMYISTKSSMEYGKMEKIVILNANKINSVITKLLYKTQILSALVIQSNGEIGDFNRVAMTIIDDPAIKNVLIAPDGVVSHVYPLENNQEVLGLDFFKDGDGNKEANLAKETGGLVLGGPFNLVQGGQALVGRLPVYINDDMGQKKFWGLVSVTLDYPQALDGAGLDQLENQGFAFEIWRVSPDTNDRQIIAKSDYHYDNGRYIEQSITILNANWNFRISPVKSWYEYPETWILTIVSLFSSLLIAFFVINNHDLKLMKTELEVLSNKDSLTGILNRRGLNTMIDNLTKKSNCVFTLCFIDLNKFKVFNDTYGHNIGDQILLKFVSVFEEHINDNHIFARIGGDEFVLIFKNTDDINLVTSFFDEIKEKFYNITLNKRVKDIEIEFSLGTSVYPTQCSDLNELLQYADQKMYLNKN